MNRVGGLWGIAPPLAPEKFVLLAPNPVLMYASHLVYVKAWESQVWCFMVCH